MTKSHLAAMRLAIEEFLLPYRVRMHPAKSRVYQTAEGFTFLGWRIFPAHARLVQDNVRRFRARLRELQYEFHAGRVTWEQVNQRVQSWIGHASHGDTWFLREKIFEEFPFVLARPPKAPGDADDGPG